MGLTYDPVGLELPTPWRALGRPPFPSNRHRAPRHHRPAWLEAGESSCWRRSCEGCWPRFPARNAEIPLGLCAPRGTWESSGPENSIGARGIKLAKRPISDLAVADHLAIFQTEITQRGKVLPSLGNQH